ncbi:MAG TPA: PDZ domain-containing protein, partial [Acidimicrobiales bacterium]|nr:PDZ domain-containing protein [Acidimicrobiales bacterium]
QLLLARLSDGHVSEATPLRFSDHDPVFTLDGKYLAFLSERTFDPVYDAHVFDLSFVAGTRPYLITLQASAPSPFAAELDGRPRGGGAQAGAGAAASATAASAAGGAAGAAGAGGAAGGGDGGPTAAAAGGGGEAGTAAAGAGVAGESPPGSGSGVQPVVVDLDGLAERVVAFPIGTGQYSQLRAARGGVLFLSQPVLGVLGEARARAAAKAPRARLLRYDLDKARQLELFDGLDGFEVSGDGLAVVVRDGHSLVVVPADRKTGEAQGDEADPDERLDVDLGRIRLEVDPPVEWAQMYGEAARLMRDHFWVADMAGVDWPAVVDRYRPWLDRIATRDDLSEMIWEVQGELGSSHAYESPPALPQQAERRVGLLGADLERDGDGAWRVARVLPGETSIIAARSPLAGPGVSIRPGDAIVAVDGRPVDPRLGPAAMLAGAAGKPVELAVLAGAGPSSGEAGGSGEARAGWGDEVGGVRRVVVEPLGDDRALRYQDWVRGRRAAVHAATGGRVGYVHIPDMLAGGWAELHRDLRVEVARDALVIDVRDNRGGHTSEIVLEKLARVVQAWDVSVHRAPLAYPSDSPRGARVLLTNELAGSDGDILTAGFRQRGLGPVIGARTWGGVIGYVAPFKLLDGSSVTQPQLSFWFYGGRGWGVENYGVEPDVEVHFPPQDWASGRDPQLERAVEVVLELLQQRPPLQPPDPATRPSRAAPPLPPRP